VNVASVNKWSRSWQ